MGFGLALLFSSSLVVAVDPPPQSIDDMPAETLERKTAPRRARVARAPQSLDDMLAAELKRKTAPRKVRTLRPPQQDDFDYDAAADALEREMAAKQAAPPTPAPSDSTVGPKVKAAPPNPQTEDNAGNGNETAEQGDTKAKFNGRILLKKHPYLALYLAGSALSLALMLASLMLFGMIAWFTKENILTANLKKLLPPDKTSMGMKIGKTATTVAFAAALSWINAAVLLWQIPTRLLRFIRDFLSPTPESVKELRFPLRNNPHLSAESVWAHTFALGILTGDHAPNKTQLLSSLDEISTCRPTLDPTTALRQLERLNVVKPDVLSASLASIAARKGDE
jgi:hypothetical protein